MPAIRLFGYNLIMAMLGIPIAIFTVWQSIRRQGGRVFAGQRIGFLVPEFDQACTPVWAHAASVGEAKAILPLISRLLERNPGLSCVITTTTPEAALIVAGKHPQIRHCYCPIDWPMAIGRFIDRMGPRLVIIVETEIWPNLYRRVARANVPLLIVNGRLSAKTMRQGKLIQALLADSLAHVDAILARSAADADNFIKLGADATRIEITGNIKLGARRGSAVQSPPALNQRRYCLAISTHQPEESLLAQTLLQLPEETLLVIVPRHPQRATAIADTLTALGVAFTIRSKGELPLAGRSVYLADTTGEVEALISGADFVFVGGSLTKSVGGHNLLEPAVWHRAIVSGPNLYNFDEESALLLAHDALTIVRNGEQLTDAFRQLSSDKAARDRQGAAAGEAIASCHSTLQRYVEKIEAWL